MSAPSQVAWIRRDRDEMHRVSWREGKPKGAPPPSAQPGADTDTHSAERAGLIERLCILAGCTAWREPAAGFSTARDSVPREHVLAAALAYARDHSGRARDVGPDILEALVLQRMTLHVPSIQTRMVRAMQDVSSRLARMDPIMLRRAAYAVIAGCVSGSEPRKPHGIPDRDWAFIASLGTSTIWMSAEQTLAAVKRTLHMDVA